MKRLLKYDWVKLERSLLPQGKGLMGSWAKLASRAAFRKGNCEYCGIGIEDIKPISNIHIIGVGQCVLKGADHPPCNRRCLQSSFMPLPKNQGKPMQTGRLDT